MNGFANRSTALAGWRAVTLLVAAIVSLSYSSSRGATRVALMPFVCEDNSYRSTVAAENLTAGLQAELGVLPGIEWVERTELEKAEQELQLSGFGLVDRSEALRSGHWVKADWAVFGRLSTNTVTGRKVSLEVVNLNRAEVLAEAAASLAPGGPGPFKLAPAAMTSLAAAVRAALEKAAAAQAAARDQAAVALLFLSADDPTGKCPELESALRQALLGSPTNHQTFRLLQFQRTGAALDEADLVLAGLAESDTNAWEKIADQYVWGNYTVRDQFRFDAAARKHVLERVVSTTLFVWDGVGEPHRLTVNSTNEASTAELADQVVTTLRPFLRRRSEGRMAENARLRLAEELQGQVMNMLKTASNPWLGSPEGRRKWFAVAQIAEAACFFAPESISARELWTRFRYSRAVGVQNRNEFFFARRRSRAWQRYVAQFGFRSVVAAPPFIGWWETNRVANEYVLSAWRPFEMFHYAQENQATWGVPRDLSGRQLREWPARFAQDFFSRLLQAKDDFTFPVNSWEFYYAALSLNGEEFVLRNARQRQRILELLWPHVLETKRAKPTATFDPDYRHALALHCQQIGKPSQERALIEEFNRAGATNLAIQPTVHHVALPRIGVLDPAEHENLFAVPPLDFPPPAHLEAATVASVRFPPAVHGVNAMALCQGKLWFALSVEEAVPAQAPGNPAERELQPLNHEVGRLWCMDPRVNVAQPVAGPVATTLVNYLISANDNLWLALAEGGVTRWNPGTGQLRQFGKAAGLASAQCSLAAASGKLFAIGGGTDFSVLEPGAEAWKPFNVNSFGLTTFFGGDLRRLAAGDDTVLFYNGALLTADLRSNSWSRWDLRLSAASPLEGLGRLACLTAAATNQFWVASDSGLHCLDLETGSLRSQFTPWPIEIDTRLQTWMPGQEHLHAPSAGFRDQVGKLLQARRRLAVARKSNPAVLNPFIPHSRSFGTIRSLAADGEFLWAATDDSRIWLYHQPSRCWVNGVKLQGRCLRLVAAAARAWVVSQANGLELTSFDLKTWAATPRQQWVPDEVSPAEITARLASLNSQQRAVYLFFAGDAAAAVTLLAPEADSNPTSESLFLLAAAYDETGLNQLPQAQRYADRLLEEFPKSVFAKCMTADRRLAAVRAKAIERVQSREAAATVGAPLQPLTKPDWVAHLIQDYDADGNGMLDQEELAVVCAWEPERVPFVGPPVNPADPFGSAKRLLEKLDQNRDDRLDTTELLRAPFFGAPSSLLPGRPPRFSPLPPFRPHTNASTLPKS